ncbi:MAG: hypothetical protein GY938_18925 [Ketobacter sp.]|nr:hypothetical protein [Planctomycetota bacterium]MCP5017318.1 hypothetical protein [Ketobacter sp.]
MWMGFKLITVLSFLCTAAWFYFQPGWDSAAAAAAAGATMLGAFVVKRNGSITEQKQKVSGNGVGIQAGGDVSVGNIGQHKSDERDAG